MDQILEGMQGVTSIADDIVVYGKDKEEHDRNLTALIEQAKEAGMVFNSDKCIIKQNNITFFGNMYTDIKPDPAKTRDIQKMPTPLNKDELDRFIGMLTYLAAYMLKFAEKVHILQGLPKNDVLWLWEADHQKCFNKICHHRRCMSKIL